MAISEWAVAQGAAVLERLGKSSEGAVLPRESTLRHCLLTTDSAALDAAVAGWAHVGGDLDLHDQQGRYPSCHLLAKRYGGDDDTARQTLMRLAPHSRRPIDLGFPACLCDRSRPGRDSGRMACRLSDLPPAATLHSK